MRSFLTEFSGEQHPTKVREEGVEWAPSAPDSTIYRKSEWWTRFDNNESVKESRFLETDPARTDKWDAEHRDLDVGEREGSNTHGQNWKESWTVNTVTGER